MAKRRSYDHSWNSYSYYPTSKPIPVEQGITLKKQRGDVGEKWWSKRWLDVLYSFNMGERLTRGKSYARKGQVISILIEKGMIQARVQGSNPRPYGITIQLESLSQLQWNKIVEAMASKAVFMAKLLNGEMPNQIEELFTETNIPLFPEKHRDLKTDCSCPDSSNPCKHIAAVYFILAEKFEEDPFLIFKLRGLAKEELIEKLRKQRVSIAVDQNEGIQTESEYKTNLQSQKSSEKRIKKISKSQKQSQGGSADQIQEENTSKNGLVAVENLDLFWNGEMNSFMMEVNYKPPLVENALYKRLGRSPLSLQNRNLTEILKDKNCEILNQARKRFLKRETPGNEV